MIINHNFVFLLFCISTTFGSQSSAYNCYCQFCQTWGCIIVGVILISGALCADAVIGNVQEKTLKGFGSSNGEMVSHGEHHSPFNLERIFTNNRRSKYLF